MYICLFFNLYFLCASVVTTFLVHYLAMETMGQGMQVLTVVHSKQLRDSSSTCDVSRGYYMLLLFLFVLLFIFLFYFSFLLFVFFLFIYFLRDSNMISISTVEFRYYVVIIVLVNLGKPSLSYTGLNQLRLISFQ